MSAPMGWRMYQKSSVVKRHESHAQHFVCFKCRKMFNKRITDEMTETFASRAEFLGQYQPPCPQCACAMPNMGNGFKPPKRSDLQKWRALERQVRAGKRFWSCPSWL